MVLKFFMSLQDIAKTIIILFIYPFTQLIFIEGLCIRHYAKC